ncbi:winged helix-turn-helix domain-containing protein [Kibdelosporangium lantanae]
MMNPMSAPDLARLAALLADRTRASFCLAMLDGRAWTAGELARTARVAASTASEHLDHLVAGGLLTQHRQGRHRYVTLANPRVAELIEFMAEHAPPTPPPSTLRGAAIHTALAAGRTCYDHLAGRLGVAVTTAMLDRGLLTHTDGLALTDPGITWLTTLGVDIDRLRRARRPLLRECLDWTERRPHLAGGVGAAVCQVFFDAGWITRTGTHRAVRLTDTGRTAIHDTLGIT